MTQSATDPQNPRIVPCSKTCEGHALPGTNDHFHLVEDGEAGPRFASKAYFQALMRYVAEGMPEYYQEIMELAGQTPGLAETSAEDDRSIELFEEQLALEDLLGETLIVVLLFGVARNSFDTPNGSIHEGEFSVTRSSCSACHGSIARIYQNGRFVLSTPGIHGQTITAKKIETLLESQNELIPAATCAALITRLPELFTAPAQGDTATPTPAQV
jgi:hypothetical protein